MDKLAKDARAAKLHRVSYGKWMAMHHKPTVRIVTEQEETTTETCHCKSCGMQFQVEIGKKQTYCSDSCRSREYYIKNREKVRKWQKDYIERKKKRAALENQTKEVIT